MAKPCTPHLIAQRVQFFKIKTANVRGQGAGPLAFSWGFKGDILSRERISPLPRAAQALLSLRLQAQNSPLVQVILHSC